ncbi:hypothetical protein MATL_G00173770 [Megalops atlanticus]|uniref:Uncharacterized protein n=1 Tax=Megalops atlanticus TaxID=7932 RepID=A0A9D3T1M2_MEGAT|nr:hypothetical protein MATL_G00173770 [Megalops atlanticus]
MNVNGVCLFCFVFPLFSGESNVLLQYSMTGETAGKHVSLNSTSGNISCTLQKGVFRAQSDPYTFYCAGLQQETGQEWCFSAGITLILVLCLMIAGCSFTIQTYCKRDNLNVQSDASHIEVTQDEDVVYSDIRFAK